MRARRTRWLMAGAAALVAIGVLVAVLVLRSGPDAEDAKPPSLGPHPADVQRVVASHGNPFSATGGIRLSGGGGVGFIILTNELVKPPLGPHEAQLGLRLDETHVDWHVVKAGDVVTEYGVRVKVLRIWRMPKPVNDAMDVQADLVPTAVPTPASTPSAT